MSYAIYQHELRIREFIDIINYEYKINFSRHSNSRFRRETKTNWLLNGMRDDIWDAINVSVKNGNTDGFTWTQICDSAQDAEWYTDLSSSDQFKYRGKPSYPAYTDHNGFQMDRDGFVRVYTDGSCFRNGSDTNAAGGVGVWFNHHHPNNVSAPFPYRKYCWPVTNNQTEIEAASVAMNVLKDEGYHNVALLTDSELVVKTMRKSLFYWLKNGWITTSGHEVINKEEFRNLLRASEGLKIKWIHVQKDYSVGNREAHELAQKGAQDYDELHNSGRYECIQCNMYSNTP